MVQPILAHLPCVSAQPSTAAVSAAAVRLADQRSVGEVFGQLAREVFGLISCRAVAVLRRDGEHWFSAATAGETGRCTGRLHAQLITEQFMVPTSTHGPQRLTGGLIDPGVSPLEPSSRFGQLGQLGHRWVVVVPMVRLGHEFGALCVYFDRLDLETGPAEVDPVTAVEVLGHHAVVALGAARERQQHKRTMESRYQVGVAQGILMARLGLSFDESFALLRDWSQHDNVKLRVVAEQVILARDALHQLPPSSIGVSPLPSTDSVLPPLDTHRRT
ncbi:MAG: ANTAR domain-containing protein [Propionibacteriaceae bacterium]